MLAWAKCSPPIHQNLIFTQDEAPILTQRTAAAWPRVYHPFHPFPRQKYLWLYTQPIQRTVNPCLAREKLSMISNHACEAWRHPSSYPLTDFIIMICLALSRCQLHKLCASQRYVPTATAPYPCVVRPTSISAASHAHMLAKRTLRHNTAQDPDRPNMSFFLQTYRSHQCN
jgi:hypothetical protein